MNLFDKFFKSKTKESGESSIMVGASADGTIVKMQDIPDEVFAEGILGTCCGIEPVEGKVYAPIAGGIVQLADTLHAIGIAGDNGVEILIHVGINTVAMNGDGFSTLIKEGAHVEKGQLLMTVDLEKIRAAGYPPLIITIVTNTGEFSSVDLVASGSIKAAEDVLKVKKTD